MVIILIRHKFIPPLVGSWTREFRLPVFLLECSGIPFWALKCVANENEITLLGPNKKGMPPSRDGDTKGSPLGNLILCQNIISLSHFRLPMAALNPIARWGAVCK